MKLSFNEESNQGRKGIGIVINKTWILLDSYSTDTVFKYPDLVANIRTGSADEELRILTNGGSVTCKNIIDCKLLPLKFILTKIPW